MTFGRFTSTISLILPNTTNCTIYFSHFPHMEPTLKRVNSKTKILEVKGINGTISKE